MDGPEPLFLDGRAGRLFLMHYRAAGGSAAVLVLPAFAEEMNKSRRQLALLGRALAARGVATLIPDLTGTGDSDGEMADATVELWVDDLARSAAYATDQGYDTVHLLALRAGALLAAPLLAAADLPCRRAVLWQPQGSGKMLVQQFLRLRVAAGLTGAADGITVKDMRAMLAAGDTVEVAGYTLSPALVSGLDALTLAPLAEAGLARVDWLTLGREAASPPPPVQRVLDALQAAGAQADYRVIDGDPFWATAEIATVPALNDATCERLT